MVTHVVAWNFKDEVKEADRENLKADMKKNLEGLVGRVPGLLSATFYTNPLPGSNRDICLITTHAKADDIVSYGSNPEHVKVAETFVRPYTKERACINVG